MARIWILITATSCITKNPRPLWYLWIRGQPPEDSIYSFLGGRQSTFPIKGPFYGSSCFLHVGSMRICIVTTMTALLVNCQKYVSSSSVFCVFRVTVEFYSKLLVDIERSRFIVPVFACERSRCNVCFLRIASGSPCTASQFATRSAIISDP